jgi:hypothetical protein
MLIAIKLQKKNITNTPSILLLQIGITKMANEERKISLQQNWKISEFSKTSFDRHTI